MSDINYDLLDYLFQFVKTNQKVNQTLAGYFSKFVICLINKK